MTTENLTAALGRCLGLPDNPAGAADPRGEFAARFDAELRVLEEAARSDVAKADSLLSALGAARVQEWDLAVALLDRGHRPPLAARRQAPSPGALRQRFQFIMSTGADAPDAR